MQTRPVRLWPGRLSATKSRREQHALQRHIVQFRRHRPRDTHNARTPQILGDGVAADPEHDRDLVAAVAADMFEAKNFSNLTHWQSLAWHGAPRDHEGETVPWLDDCSRTAPSASSQGRLECLGITGWLASESPAALRRNARLASVGIRSAPGGEVCLIQSPIRVASKEGHTRFPMAPALAHQKPRGQVPGCTRTPLETFRISRCHATGPMERTGTRQPQPARSKSPLPLPFRCSRVLKPITPYSVGPAKGRRLRSMDIPDLPPDISFVRLRHTAAAVGFAFEAKHAAMGPQHHAPLGSVVHGSEVETQQPLPRLRSGNADIARASKLQHAVEDMHGHVDFRRPTFVHT